MKQLLLIEDMHIEEAVLDTGGTWTGMTRLMVIKEVHIIKEGEWSPELRTIVMPSFEITIPESFTKTTVGIIVIINSIHLETLKMKETFMLKTHLILASIEIPVNLGINVTKIALEGEMNILIENKMTEKIKIFTIIIVNAMLTKNIIKHSNTDPPALNKLKRVILAQIVKLGVFCLRIDRGRILLT